MRRFSLCAVALLAMATSVDAGAPLTGPIGNSGSGIYYGGPELGITGAIGGINGGGSGGGCNGVLDLSTGCAQLVAYGGLF